MRILLVDDQNKATPYLRRGLAENGFAVDVASQGDQGLDLARRADYDLMVVNSRLEWPLFSELRRSGRRTPVLFLASLNGFSEFLTRIHTALGWRREGGLERIEIGDLELDLMRQRAARAGRRLDLTHKEFLLLSLLARREGEVLSRAFIADQVWDINFDSNTNFVDVHIRRLRSKLDDPFEKKLIHTVRGRGYLLEDRA
jgi:two-component system copper resistance phosphate regulon response regulator CusR